MAIAEQGPPVQKVMDMKKQGLSNNQIIQTLQNDKYGLDDIFNAMSLAEAKEGVNMNQPNPIQNQPPMPMESQSTQLPPMGSPNPGLPPDMPGSPNMGTLPNEQQAQSQQIYSPSPTTERIEELAEAIIDEKWNEIVRSINKIIDWKDRTESKITKLEQSLQDIKHQFDTLHKGVLGKIGDYDRNLMTIGSDIKAMEKVFGEVLPVMTENVNELSRITKDMKKK